MSDRPCNLCNLERMRREAKKAKQRIVVVPVTPAKDHYKLGGSDIYRVSQGKKLDVKRDWCAWFMMIPSRCEC